METHAREADPRLGEFAPVVRSAMSVDDDILRGPRLGNRAGLGSRIPEIPTIVDGRGSITQSEIQGATSCRALPLESWGAPSGDVTRRAGRPRARPEVILLGIGQQVTLHILM
jgi:hypothetical protein